MFKFIGKQFRKPSGLGGRIIDRLMIKGNLYAYDLLIPEMKIKSQDKLFEIGYGHGMGIAKISDRFDCIINGIDYSPLMYKQATKRNKKHIEAETVKLYYGDFLIAKLVDLGFDTAFCINVVYFWDDLEAAFSKVRSLLKKEGRFFIFMVRKEDLVKLKFTSDDIFNKYTIEDVVMSLEKAGFKNINYKLEKAYVISCQR